MDKPENRLKKYLVSIMGSLWDVQSHEDRFSEGIPDLSYGANSANGWIELKQIPRWPVLAETKTKPSHYTPNQVSWINRRGKKGGRCFVLVKVGTEYFLFSFKEARSVRAGMTRKEYGEKCILYWKGRIDKYQLIEELTK